MVGGSLVGGMAASTGGGTAVTGDGDAPDPLVYYGAGDPQDDTKNGVILAFHAKSGEEVWKAEHENNVHQSAPIIVDGSLFVGADRGWDSDNSEPEDGSAFYVLDAETGSITTTWDDDSVEPLVRGGPTVVDDTVYFGTFDGRIFARNTSDLNLNWGFDVEDHEGSTPDVSPNTSHNGVQVVDGSAYVTDTLGTQDGFGKLYSLDADTGDVEWSFDPGENSSMRRYGPLVYDGLVYASADETLYAFDPDDGAVIWEHDGSVQDHPITVDGLLYTTDDRGASTTANDRVVALDAATGEVEWGYTVNNPPRLTVDNGTVYGAGRQIDANGNLYALDAQTGEVLWITEPVDVRNTLEEVLSIRRYTSVPTVHDGLLYTSARANSTDGDETYALAFDAWDGTPEWVYVNDDTPLSGAPTVVADPADGSSVGSRARLGTDGHHHDWTGSDAVTAVVDIDPRAPTIDEQAAFDGSNSFTPADQIDDYEWDFTGDGVTDETGETVEYTFDEWGQHDVTLTVTDSDGDEHARTISITVELPPIAGFENPPQDLDGDGRYRDINGDGEVDISDVRALQQNLDDDVVQNHPAAFNFADTDPPEVTEVDLEALFEQITGGESV